MPATKYCLKSLGGLLYYYDENEPLQHFSPLHNYYIKLMNNDELCIAWRGTHANIDDPIIMKPYEDLAGGWSRD